ncbi:MAG: hypothetical protein KDA24_23845 [Deltaproteobacteria bacterium]|nr:hypothetical protein [Deltaproteobacteria bacterium]
MQYRPTQEELLLAIADFIEGDVRPQLDDRALSFRCLIAANLARMCVMERRMEEWHDGLELDSLRTILDDLPAVLPPTKEARRDLLEQLNSRLARDVRKSRVEMEPTAAHLRTVLKGRLSVTNPRFDADFGWQALEGE